MGDFENAVDTVVAWVEEYSCWQDTLLVVTSDHETGGVWSTQSWHDVDADKRYTPATDTFIKHLPPRRTKAGARPDLAYGTDKHTSDLVPLWAIGVGARALENGAQFDAGAESIWGPAMAWNGLYIDNTRVCGAITNALGLSSTGELIDQ